MKIKSVKKVKSDYPIRFYDIKNSGKNCNFIVKTNTSNIVSHNCGMLDEIEFVKGSAPQIEQSSVMKLYNTVKRRIESRFMKKGQTPGVLFLVSSKNRESDFLEQYINKNRNNPKLLIADEPIWVIKAKPGMYSGETFKVLVGNRLVGSKIISEEEAKVYEKSDYKIIDVPIEYREAFELDIDSAIRDIAGVAVSNNLKFFNYDKLKSCYDNRLKNLFISDTVILDFDDSTELKDFISTQLLDQLDKKSPKFIHWDPSLTGDATGLSMVSVGVIPEANALVEGQVVKKYNQIDYELNFSVRIKPTVGKEIPFDKIRNFIYFMKENVGINLLGISCDGFQSRDSQQQLKRKNYPISEISVDKTRAPYDSLRNAINEGRFRMFRSEILEKEFLDVELDPVRNKVDHTVTGSKDILDSVAASVYNATLSKGLFDNTLTKKTDSAKALLAINKRLSQLKNNNRYNPNYDWLHNR